MVHHDAAVGAQHMTIRDRLACRLLSDCQLGDRRGVTFVSRWYVTSCDYLYM